LWDELTKERQEEEIARLSRETYGLQPFFDGAHSWYNETMKGIEAETDRGNAEKYKAVKFIRDKASWQSGSQGWYYDHCGPQDFLVHKDFCVTEDRFCLELRDVDSYPARCGRWGYDHDFEWCLLITDNGITHEYSGSFRYIQEQFENEGWDVPIEAIRLVKEHEEQYRVEFEELQKRIEKEIQYYSDYWPSDEEIGDYFRANEVEFVIDEDEVERTTV
jgi:hypothetical protein